MRKRNGEIKKEREREEAWKRDGEREVGREGVRVREG